VAAQYHAGLLSSEDENAPVPQTPTHHPNHITISREMPMDLIERLDAIERALTVAELAEVLHLGKTAVYDMGSPWVDSVHSLRILCVV
jgi:hypothetical protein